MNIKVKRNIIIFGTICVGLILRFFVMTLGHNFDFESYCVVGEIASRFGNVYVETPRYNYGPVFMVFQGLFYYLASFVGENINLIFRLLIVGMLSFVDLGIASILLNRCSLKAAVFFFLNPVSIIITGYHNQFDNMAVLFALLMVFCYSEEKKFCLRDLGFVCFFTLSLTTKHILFMFPMFLLFKQTLSMKKKILYVFAPPFIFLMSFLPFIIGNKTALDGIIQHVFLYRSYNNSPFLNDIYQIIGMPDAFKFFIYVFIMIGIALLTRNVEFDKQVYLYLLAMVTFSSAIANQYLVIPIAALCILSTNVFYWLYVIEVGGYLILEHHGLGFYNKFEMVMGPHTKQFLQYYIDHAYSWATWILCLCLFIEIIKMLKKKDNN